MSRLKRVVVWMMLVACFTLVAAPLQAAAATQSVKVIIDEKPLKLVNSPAPFVEKGRTLVPVRGVFEQLGLNVKWNQKANTATITGNNVTIQMKPNAKQVTVNGKTKTVDVPVKMKNNRLFIPLRFVSEEAGVGVKWDQKANTVYLTSASKGNLVADTDAFLKKLIEANEKLTSFSTEMDIEQAMTFDGETMNMDMSLLMDIVMDPLGFYQEMSMSMEELDGVDLSMKSYFTKDGLYTYESDTDQWIKYDDDLFEELIGLSDLQMDPKAQFELMSKFVKDLKVYELDNAYEMHFNISNAGFEELLDFVLDFADLGLEDEDFADLGIEFNIDKMSIVTTVDKETYFPISEKMDSKMTVSFEGETISIVQKASGKYSKHNQVKEIVIPKEVIDSAISFEEYLEQLDLEEDAA